MKFHNIRMVGPFNNEHLTVLPTFDTSKDPGRLVWLDDGSLWYGETDRWVKILASDGGGDTIHNDLVGRSDNDCHPISAITGLEEALGYAGMRWEIKNATFQVEDHIGYLVDTTSGEVSATLPDLTGMAPSATLGMVTEIVDINGNFDSNKVTVLSPDGELIMGLNEPLEIDTEWASATLVYSDTAHGWIVTDGKSGGCESGGQGGIQWNIVSSSQNAQSFNGYFVDTENNAVVLTLTSTPEKGDIVKVVDYNGYANTNNITIDPNGYKINSSPSASVLDIDRSGITLVYSDADEGWVIENAFKTSDTGGGGIIDTDTTIYLAPSAAADAPTGSVIGSDTTGDGSIDRPFYSIKRALDYLSDYRIKVGKYVTIRGLSGYYRYNENHAIVVKHKDAKYIKVEFDMMEGSNYHSTTITTDTVSVDSSNSSYDLITFTVGATGSGFYGIKANDYIKILTDVSLKSDHNVSVWNGFYRVHSVDEPNAEITIVFKRHQKLGSYASHTYKLPDTISSGQTINVVKLSTHVYINKSSAPYGGDHFFYSEYGFGGIQMNVSDEVYYQHTDGTRGWMSCINIYDGILNNMIINVNGFDRGVNLTNLQCHYYYSTNYIYDISCYTSCSVGLRSTQSEIDVRGTFNNCETALMTFQTSCVCDASYKSVSTNNYNHGYSFWNGSSIHIGSDNTQSDIINSFYNYEGVQVWYSSTSSGVGWNLQYNVNGLSIHSNSRSIFYGTYQSGTTRSNLSYNVHNGILLNDSSSVDTVYSYISYNDIGIKCLSSTINNIGDCDIDHNTSYGIYLTSRSNCIISNTLIYNNDVGISSVQSSINTSDTLIHDNTGSGITCTGSSLSMSGDEIYNNGGGIYITYNSSMDSTGISVHDNGNYGLSINRTSKGTLINTTVTNNTNGIIVYYVSKIYYYTTNSSYTISGNSSNDLLCGYNSNADLYVKAAISSTSPAKNSSPSYSNANSNNYILETVY